MQLVVKEDSNQESKVDEPPKKSPPKKAHNFYYQEDTNQADDTPDFQDYNDRVSEVEKRMDLSNEKSQDDSDKKIRKAKTKPVMTFNLDDENDDEDDEAVPIETSTQPQQPKHKFNNKGQFKMYTDDYERDVREEQEHKVEEPEETDEAVNQNQDEDNFVVAEKPRTTQQRNYRAWERSNNQGSPKEKGQFDPEKEYISIAERIKNRNTQGQVEYQSERSVPQEVKTIPAPPKQEQPREVEVFMKEGTRNSPLTEPSESFDQSNNQMMSRLQNLKDQCNDIESNMDRMIRTSKNFYQETNDHREHSRHTINVPPSNFNYDRGDIPVGRGELEFSYNRGNQSAGLQSNHSNSRKSHFEAPREPLEYDNRSQQNRGYETPLQRPGESNQISMLIDEIKYLRAQQDKILENQNIFQTYISNEITSLKNKMNQLEGDMLLSKTLSSSHQRRGDLGHY